MFKLCGSKLTASNVTCGPRPRVMLVNICEAISTDTSGVNTNLQFSSLPAEIKS